MFPSTMASKGQKNATKFTRDPRDILYEWYKIYKQ